MAARCKDCTAEALQGVIVGSRPAPYPGPRCATHHRLRRRTSKDTQHERYVQRTYGLGEGDYDRLYEHQGRKCAICRRSTGKVKKLAVDHDHDNGLAYGLLCGPCNRDVLGWSRRDVAYFQRAIEYLKNPPAKQLNIVAYHQDKRKESGTGNA